MSADEFRRLVIGKTEHEATSQNNVIYKALTHARMVAAELVDPAPSDYDIPIPEDGGDPDSPRPKAGVEMEALIEFDRDKPRCFSLEEVRKHIEFLQAARLKKGTQNTERVPPGDFAKDFKSILDKLAMLRRDPRIQFMMQEWNGTKPFARTHHRPIGRADPRVRRH